MNPSAVLVLRLVPVLKPLNHLLQNDVIIRYERVVVDAQRFHIIIVHYLPAYRSDRSAYDTFLEVSFPQSCVV